ncbi:hypothetical protein ACERZ8_21295 [Tateyamaria armeniaca]|uniref:Uncharacterized protein n=1 Tax=Tateyamaria armeniaca TaxID=2518930 RepID=A0ABW8UYP7_9RHOB
MADAEAVNATKLRTYPEVGAGGFTRIDGTIEFFARIAALTEPDHVVLDLGAGRGANFQEDPAPYRRALLSHRDRCARVIGVDVDPVVKTNPSLQVKHTS